MLDMSEFGEAAEYLRKSYTEQLKLQTIPFDGKTPRQLLAQPQGSPWPWLSLESVPVPFPVLLPMVLQVLQNCPHRPGGQEDLRSRKSRFLTVPLSAEVWAEVLREMS